MGGGGAGVGGGGGLGAAGGAPAFAVFADPVEKGSLEADVVAEAFGFEPLVFQDFFTLGEEFLIEARLLHEFTGRFVGLVLNGLHGDHGDYAARLLKRFAFPESEVSGKGGSTRRAERKQSG